MIENKIPEESNNMVCFFMSFAYSKCAYSNVSDERKFYE